MSFAVATIRPSGQQVQFERDGATEMTPGTLRMRDVTISTCIKWAYGVQRPQVAGPEMLERDHYDIVAKPDMPVDSQKMKMMMQALLADRFKLTFHHEQREMRRYAMLVLPTGSRLKKADPEGEPFRQNSAMGTVARSTTMQEWADFLAGPLETPVVDRTGLPGRYDFAIDFTPYLPKDQEPVKQDPGYILNMALKGDLGLKLESGKGPVDVLVVDHVEKPSEN